MPNFTVKPLDLKDIMLAYPLVRMGMPDVHLVEGQDYVGSLLANGGGVLTLVAPDGGIHALACWNLEQHLRHELVLKVDTFVAFELSHRAPARAALCEGLQELADGLGCSTVLFTLESRGLIPTHSPTLEAWRKLGSELEAIQLARPVNPGVSRLVS